MKNRNFLVLIVLSLVMVAGLSDLAKGQCPTNHCSPLPQGCGIGQYGPVGCYLYYITNTTPNCWVSGFTACTGETGVGCDHDCPNCDTASCPPSVYPSYNGGLFQGGAPPIAISWISNACGCFCVDALTIGGVTYNFSALTGIIPDPTEASVPCACCPGGIAYFKNTATTYTCDPFCSCPPASQLPVINFTLSCTP